MEAEDVWVALPSGAQEEHFVFLIETRGILDAAGPAMTTAGPVTVDAASNDGTISTNHRFT